MSDDHAHGQRDGLRLALAVRAKGEAMLGQSRSGRINATRRVRQQDTAGGPEACPACSQLPDARHDTAVDAKLAAALGKLGL